MTLGKSTTVRVPRTGTMAWRKQEVKKKMKQRALANGGTAKGVGIFSNPRDVHSKDAHQYEPNPYNFGAFLDKKCENPPKTDIKSDDDPKKDWASYLKNVQQDESTDTKKRKRSIDDESIPKPRFTFSDPTWCGWCGFICQNKEVHMKLKRDFDRYYLFPCFFWHIVVLQC